MLQIQFKIIGSPEGDAQKNDCRVSQQRQLHETKTFRFLLGGVAERGLV